MGEANRRKKTDPSYGSEPKETPKRGWHRLRRSRRGRASERSYRLAAEAPKGESRQTVRREGRELDAAMKRRERDGLRAERLEAARKAQRESSLRSFHDKPRRFFSKGLAATKYAAPRLLSKNGRWSLARREARA